MFTFSNSEFSKVQFISGIDFSEMYLVFGVLII